MKYIYKELLCIQEKNLVSRNWLDIEDQLNIAQQAVEYGFLGLISFNLYSIDVTIFYFL